MYPGFAAKFAVDSLSARSSFHVYENTDLEYHLTERAKADATVGGWYLRLLPKALRDRLLGRLTAQVRERQLIRLWETSPHLLRDAGFVLSDSASLPENLVAAPAAVIAHVAAHAPEQVAEAEESYPPRKSVPEVERKVANLQVPSRAAWIGA